MRWIYLSPHLDDAALSCGALIHHQTQNGDVVEVWTTCAGDPPPVRLSPFAQSLHDRWETPTDAVEIRREEDRDACRILGAKPVHFGVPDCIYRRHPLTDDALYASEDAIFGVLDPAEYPLVEELAGNFRNRLAETDAYRVVSPLGIGGHVDHDLTCRVAEALGCPLFFYADYPYAMGSPLAKPEDLHAWGDEITQRDLLAWQDSVQSYHSQLSTFWKDTDGMKNALLEFHKQQNGVYLWCPG